MIEFMIIGAPRSGTAWAANWLSTDTTVCLHDPLWRWHYQDWDAIPVAKGMTMGVACTGILYWPGFLHEHPARKVILHRPIGEVNASLARLGIEPIADLESRLCLVGGMHMPWHALFEPNAARRIYEFLLQKRFDPRRHEELVRLNVQARLQRIHADPEVARRLVGELAAAVENRS